MVPQAREGKTVQGSRAVTSPFTSYGALIAEVGLLGFLVMVAWASARMKMPTITRKPSRPTSASREP